jgi:hypothetical protein
MKQESALEPVDKKKIAEVKPPKVDKSVLDDLTSSPDKQAKKPDKGEERDA